MAVGNVTPQTFAVSVLQGIRAPVTPANVQALVGWQHAEGGNWNNSARYNPLNTTESMPGAGNTGSQGNIKVYQNWGQGVQATVKTLQNGLYQPILAALHAGNDPMAVAKAIGSSQWGTNGALVAQTIAQASGSLPSGATTIPGGSPGKLAASPKAMSAPTSTATTGSGSNPAAQIAAQYINSTSGRNDPFNIGLPKTGISTSGASDPLSSALSQAAGTSSNPSDLVTAQTQLQKLAGGTALQTHPGATTAPVLGQALHDAAAAGVSGDGAKLLRMIDAVIGGPYSQANHAGAISQNEATVKRLGTDCSGLISWLMGPQGLGIWNTALATPDIPHAPGLQPGQGSTITIWNNAQAGNAGHVFIRIGSQFFASEGGTGIRQLPMSEVRMYLTQGSDGGHYQAFHPKGL